MKTFPLMQSQLGIYHAWIADPSSVAYNLPAVVPFPRSIDHSKLERALAEIWQERQELHTRIDLNGEGEPCQWADPNMPLPLTETHMTEKDAQDHIAHGFVRPFDIMNGQPLVRFEIIETETHSYLLCDFHHLICDGMTLSQAFLNNDLPDAYSGKSLTPHPYGLYQHAEAERQAMHSEQYQQAKLHYQQLFQHIHFTCLSEKTTQPWGKRLQATITLKASPINRWCQEQHITPNLLFMAAFSIVLSRLSGNQQVAYATLHHGRSDRRLTHAYGMFVTSMPILAEVRESLNIPDFLHQLRNAMRNAIRHQSYPLTHLCRDLHQTPSITFAFQGSHIIEETTIEGKTIYGYQPVQGTTKNDLSCMIYSTKDLHYEIRTEASSQLWSQQRMETIAKAVAACVQSLMNHAQESIADISIITPEEEATLLQLGQGEHLDYDHTQTIISLFLQQAERTPNALAVTDGCISLTYKELDSHSAAFAKQLQQEGVKPGDFVPITTGRCTKFLVQALGIMRMGAAYVPIDTDWPKSRQQQVIDAAHATKNTQGQAYLLHTSGTTGKPKGVMISHRALLNFIHSIVHIFGLTADSRISCHSSFAFDASVEDLFPVLTVGGSVHIMLEDTQLDPKRIHHFLLRHHITGGCYTTHLGIYLAKHFDLPMDYLCLGGEQLTTYPHTHPRVFNTYGPTEFTVDATYYELPPGLHEGTPPIGRPLPNLTAYVMDAHNHLLPRGEVGELCLEGIQKATNCTATPYHTGDLVRWNEQGQLEYIGRRDRQLKLRGYRIEPEEIEKKLEQLDGILQAVVVANPQQTYLTAYYTTSLPTNDERLDENRIGEKLKQTLPHYMVPTRFIRLDEMPLTTANKPDYTQLPILKDPHEYTPPTNNAERLWCELFAKVTGTSSVSATDNFFHIGGTSILVASLQAEALQLGIHLSYGDVYEAPTPRQLATRIPHLSPPNSQLPPINPQPSTRNPQLPTPIAPLLLTGATGFLGSHVLHEFLLQETGVAYCLVRAHDEMHAYQRLRDTLNGTGLETFLGTRIIPVGGDLQTLIPQQLPAPVSTVIHCAADTRHFAPNHLIEDTNILGTDRIIDFCLTKHARLIHISTLSIDPTSASPYIRSKTIAEQHVLEAINNQGLQATIMRIGNLVTDTSELTNNTLKATLYAFRLLGEYPQQLADLPIDLSRVDDTARAILLLATHASNQTLLQPYNPHTTSLGTLLQASGDIHPVSDTQFQATLTKTLSHPENHPALVPLLHYQAMSTSTLPTLPDNTLTTQLLHQLHFHWQQ